MSSAENLAPQVVTRVMGEIRQLVRSKSEGIEYVTNDGGMSLTLLYPLCTERGICREICHKITLVIYNNI